MFLYLALFLCYWHKLPFENRPELIKHIFLVRLKPGFEKNVKELSCHLLMLPETNGQNKFPDFGCITSCMC